LYSRFWHKFLFDIGVVPTTEPYQRRVSHGMILAEGGEKMSKSKGNVINPDDVVKEYGADVLRAYEMFIGPYDQPVAWDTNGMKGIKRFQDRVWNFKPSDKEEPTVTTLLQKTIQKVTDDIVNMRFNTAVSALMILLNDMSDKGATKATFKTFVVLLSPFMPHLAEELSEKLGGEGSVQLEKWPVADVSLIAEEAIEVPIQVNGKVRDKISISADMDEAAVKKLALASANVRKYLEGKEVKKFIYVKGRMVSIVV
jgi:leucyl-tRNA synthetase